MAIMQRFGIRHDSTFFLAENMNGALSQLQKPISSERDCWLGKYKNMKFNISTQHLKYNKTLIDSVMMPNYKSISIIRNQVYLVWSILYSSLMKLTFELEK